MKKSISILGTGWLGLPLGIHLRNKGFEINGSIRNPNNLEVLRSNGINPFLLDFEETNSLVNLKSFLASTNTLIISIPPSGQSNYSALFRPLIVCLKALAKLPQIVFISSTSIYGDAGHFDEESKQFSVKPRAQQILDAENLFIETFPENTIVLRLAGLAGPGRNPGRFLAGKLDVQNPNGPVNFIHLADCIEIITQLIQESVPKGIFNVCAPKHPGRRAFYTLHSTQLSLEAPRFITDNNGSSKIIDANKITDRLNYTFIYPDPMYFEF